MSEQFTLNVIDVMAQGIRRVKAWLDPMNPAPDPHTIKDIHCVTYECEEAGVGNMPRYFTEYEYTRYVPLQDSYGRIKFKGVVGKVTPQSSQTRITLTLTVSNAFAASDNSDIPTIITDVPKRKKPYQTKQHDVRDIIYKLKILVYFEDNAFYTIDHPTVTFYNPRSYKTGDEKARIRAYDIMHEYYPKYNFGSIEIIHVDASFETLRSKFLHALGILNT